MNEQKANELFDTYITGNLSYFRHEVRKLQKVNLLKCIDILINQYGHTFDNKDILRIFLYQFLTNS